MKNFAKRENCLVNLSREKKLLQWIWNGKLLGWKRGQKFKPLALIWLLKLRWNWQNICVDDARFFSKTFRFLKKMYCHLCLNKVGILIPEGEIVSSLKCSSHDSITNRYSDGSDKMLLKHLYFCYNRIILFIFRK